MAHFAKLNDENIVLEVLVVDNEDIQDSDNNEVEQLGVELLSNITGHDKWKQTSYNANIRKNYAAIGMVYDDSLSCFHATEHIHDSWTLNEDTCKFEAPEPMPDDGKEYIWSELTLEWVEQSEPVNEE